MIRPSPSALLWGCVAAAVLAWGWLRLGQADERWRAALEQSAALHRDVQRLGDLRGRIQAPVRGRRPQDDLVSRAQQALTAAGLPVSAFSGVQPRADQTANGLRIQTVQLRLQGLRPAEFGAWLAAWTTPDQPWRLGELQMTHAAAGQTPLTALDTNRFDLTLVLTAPYVEDRP